MRPQQKFFFFCFPEALLWTHCVTTNLLFALKLHSPQPRSDIWNPTFSGVKSRQLAGCHSYRILTGLKNENPRKRRELRLSCNVEVETRHQRRQLGTRESDGVMQSSWDQGVIYSRLCSEKIRWNKLNIQREDFRPVRNTVGRGV